MRNIGKWTSSNKAIDITGIPHGPWIPTSLAGGLDNNSVWWAQCSKCGFTPKKPMYRQNLLRAKNENQEFCRHCPKELRCPSP